MKTVRLILGDQLTRSVSALRGLDPVRDVVLMVEVHEETCYVRHHKQKIVFVLSAMRHFSESLRAEGVQVDHVQLDDTDNSGTFTGELARAVKRHRADQVVATEPGEWRVLEKMLAWSEILGRPVDIREDDRFFCSRAEFANWAKGRADLRMEFFYRQMRRKTSWLMSGSQPEGGRWNFDSENRKALPTDMRIPPRLRFAPDTVTRQVMRLVTHRFPDHFGELEPFGWAVKREDSLKALQHFVTDCLPSFGVYQDAMRSGSDFLFHSVLSPYMNIGLLTPKEVCEAVLAAYHEAKAPLPAVEGFLRQVLGWREFVRGVYWLHAPSYGRTNFFGADRALPQFYWTGETDMNCLREAIRTTRLNAYAHHIQRLMITGNFALLAGLSPAEVEEWYLAVYADAFEWVELPNTHGMALHADGGVVGSKPYAASGAYIHRMSDYCAGCSFDPKVRLGPGACPFNFLYWRFLIVHETKLRSNPRMAFSYRNLDRMTSAQRQEFCRQGEDFLALL